MKLCGKCKQEKDEREFSKDKTKSDGLSFWCKACKKKRYEDTHVPKKDPSLPKTGTKEYNRIQYLKYRDSQKEKRKNDPTFKERQSKASKKYNAKRKAENPDVFKAGYQRNRENQLTYSRKNKVKKADYLKNWQKVNPGKCRQYSANRRARIKANGGVFTWAQFMQVFELFGRKCAYCRCDLTEQTVTVDHVIPISKGGRNSIDNLAPACKSCNSSKKDRTDWQPIIIIT